VGSVRLRIVEGYVFYPSTRGDRTGPGWAWAVRPKPAGLAHSEGRFAPPFLALEGSSTLKSWRCRNSQGGEPFAPGGHPQARERGGRSPEEDRPSRRKHPQVEKKEDTVGSVTIINGARREISGGGSTISKEAPTSGEEGRHRRKRHHNQRCYV
jgi:hypothetical protein